MTKKRIFVHFRPDALRAPAEAPGTPPADALCMLRVPGVGLHRFLKFWLRGTGQNRHSGVFCDIMSQKTPGLVPRPYVHQRKRPGHANQRAMNTTRTRGL